MKKQDRKSIRLKGFDYSEAGLYFLTLVTKDRQHYFGGIIDGEMYLNLYGQIAAEEWKKTLDLRPNISLEAFIIMPNHMHAIVQIDYQVTPLVKEAPAFRSPSQTIGALVRGYKGATTKRIKNIARNYGESGINIPSNTTIDLKQSIWQRNYYDIIIRNERMYQNITNYILNNPQKWEEDKHYRKK
jgi:REP element-mobilizing transposase RayT